jgi:predicted ATPase
VQDAAYESLLKSKRRELHGRIAKVLEDEFAESVETEPELLAHHYTEATITEPALDYWLRAGKRAIERCAHLEASTHLKRGLALVETLPEGEPRIRKEITFRVALGVPLLGASTTSPEVTENYNRAQELCEQLGETEQLFPVLWGLWYHHMNRFQMRRACELADQLLEVALGRKDEALRLEAHHCQWASRLLVGEPGAALEHTEQGLQLYRVEDHHALTFTYGGHDPGVCAQDVSAIAFWLLGYPERANERFEEAIGLAGGLGHSGTLANQLIFRIVFSAFQQDKYALERHAEALRDFAGEGPTDEWQIMAQGARGWAMFEQGECEAGLALMRESVKLGLGQDPWNIDLISLVAAALGHCDAVEEGLELVNETLKRGQHDNVHWWEAELRRVKGELLLMGTPDNPGTAEDCFKQAIEIAQLQSAKSLELRAAMNLARLWQERGEIGEARDILAPVFEWFTEGFDTPDLIEAKKVLAQLA